MFGSAIAAAEWKWTDGTEGRSLRPPSPSIYPGSIEMLRNGNHCSTREVAPLIPEAHFTALVLYQTPMQRRAASLCLVTKVADLFQFGEIGCM